LIYLPIGSRKNLERLSIEQLVMKASPYPFINAHPEPCESTSRQTLSEMRVMT